MILGKRDYVIGKITVDLVEKCSDFIKVEDLQRFQTVLSLVLGEYDIKEKEYAIIPYDEKINKAYQMFFISKKIEGLSNRSLYAYKAELEAFRKSISKPFDTVTTDDIRYYLAMKQLKDGIAESTADNIRRVLSTFYVWLTAEGYVARNPVLPLKKIKTKRKVKHAFTDIEIEKLKEACLNIEKPLRRKRDIAIIETLLSTGCRVGELTSIKLSDIDFVKKSILVTGKGNKERIVYLNDKSLYRINEYLEERKDTDVDYLFVSVEKPYRRLQISGVEIMIRELGREVGISECHPHKFRRTSATIALRRGMDLVDIQKMLGHENLETTKIYLDLNNSNLEYQHKRIM